MKRVGSLHLALSLAVILPLTGCGGDTAKNPAAEAPPPAQVEHEGDSSIVQVENASQFPLATAVEYKAAPQLIVTGVVSPDVSRTVPVISIASGRVVEIRARLGDTVKKGQLLLRVQSADIAGAYSDFGGDSYIRAMKGPFHNVPLVASGGVNQHTAANFILAGAAALGIGGELIPKDAIRLRQAERIFTLAHRFAKFVKDARALLPPKIPASKPA